MTTERDVIIDAYYDRLKLLFTDCAEDLASGNTERFNTGLAQAKASRDCAMKLIQEKK